MFPVSRPFRNPSRVLRVFALTGLVAACQAGGGLQAPGPGVEGRPVEGAMPLPVGSARGGDAVISRNLENAARMAAADMGGVTIEIAVYDTAGQAAQAATVARQAVSDGADVIVGPLRSDAAAAVGVAVSNATISVLSFSNNTEIAGGNVFVLGHTFQNTAHRVIGHAGARGRTRLVVAHADTLAGRVARDAVARAAQGAGVTILGTVPYEFSQTGVIDAVPEIVDLVRSSDATGVMLTSDSAGALPFFAQLLPENGLDVDDIRMMGLTRWDIPPQTLRFAGLQGGWFALPDPSATADFEARYIDMHGEAPHLLAALGYDAIRAVGETAASAGRLTGAALAASAGFEGANGVFRLRTDGTNQRAMAVAQVIDNQVAVIDPAPRRLGGAGF